MPDDAIHREATKKDQQKRRQPEDQRLASRTRSVQRELTVSRDQDIDNYRVRLAYCDQPANLPSQIGGQEDVRVLDTLILTYEAADFRDQLFVTGL